MKIDRLNQGTILVSMAAQDLRDYKLDFGKETEPNAVHSGLKRLLHHVGERCSITPGGRSFLIEALPSKEGCLLLISVRSARRHVYRVKGGFPSVVCVFERMDDLLDWMLRERDLRYTLYRFRGLFVLLPSHTLSLVQRRRLGEYGRMIAADRIMLARVKEYGEKVNQRNF